MYTYKNLTDDIAELKAAGVETGTIGKTVLGCDIPYVFLRGGKSRKTIIVQGSIHAREHITTALIMEQIKFYLSGGGLDGNIFFVPMLNIDGVRLCQEGADFIEDEARREFILKVNSQNGDFSSWKANANAVDLNTNFAARWGTGEQNARCPAPSSYIGPCAVSECETAALVRFTEEICPDSTISYHIRGEEIYWDFFQSGAEAWRDRAIAEILAVETGYKVIGGLASAGGYKDWCIQEFGIPAYTIEVGNMDFPFPFPYTELPLIFQQNKNVPLLLLNEI